MLFALRQPQILLGLVLGFAVGVGLRAEAQRWLVKAPRRRDWAGYLDPYGTVAAVVAGVGWGARIPARRGGGRGASRRGGPAGLLLAALVVHGVLAGIGFAAYRAAGGLNLHDSVVSVTDVLHGSLRLGNFGVQVSGGFAVINLACGLLALLPIPPLELGNWLWSRLPRSPGARRVGYHLLEEAWGVAVVLLGLLLPLAGQAPAFLALIDAAGRPLLRWS